MAEERHTHINHTIITRLNLYLVYNTHTWGPRQRCVRRTCVNSVRRRMVFDCDRSVLAPPSGWRCSTETRSRSLETKMEENKVIKKRTGFRVAYRIKFKN